MVEQKLKFLSNGNCPFSVLLSENHSKSQKYAADELVKYIGKYCGVNLPLILSDKTTSDKTIPDHLIILGDHPIIQNIAPHIKIPGLEEEGFYWDINQDHIIIAGSKIRGTIYGVYEFLTKFFKIEFFDPEYIVVPEYNNEDIDLPLISEKHLPSFQYRLVTYLNLLDPEFAVTQKCNMNPFAEEEMGGSYHLSTAHLTHTFYQIIDPKKYYEEHPEYFALVNGKREGNLAQLCLTNPDVIKIATETVLKWFKVEPNVMSMGVIQNDINGYCECENCRKIEEHYGGVHSATIITFCNAIAEKVAEQYPEKYIHTIAYTYSLQPPKGLKVAKNILVVPCDMYPECADHKPIGKDPLTEPYLKYIKEWSELTENLIAWHYAVDFVHFLLPFPNVKSLYENVKIYKSLGFKGLFFQASTQIGVYGEFEEFKNWFLYKILWDIDLEYENLIETFISGYYGRSAPLILEYFTELQKLAELPDVKMHLYSGLEAGYLTKEFVMKYQKKIESELELLKNQNGSEQPESEQLISHIEKVLLSLDYAYLIFLVKYKAVLGKIYPEDLEYRTKVYTRFKEYLKKFRIGVIAESLPVRSFLEKQDIICSKNSILAIAELAPTVMGILSSLLDKVKSSLDEKDNFKPNDFIISALKSGIHPLELANWMNEKQIGLWTNDANIWTRKFNHMGTNALLKPEIPKTRKNDLPSAIFGLIKNLPNQHEEFEEE